MLRLARHAVSDSCSCLCLQLSQAADSEGFEGLVQDLDKADERIRTLTRELDRANAQVQDSTDALERLQDEVRLQHPDCRDGRGTCVISI